MNSQPPVADIDPRKRIIIDTLHNNPEGLGFNELDDSIESTARPTLQKHRDELQELGLIEVISEGQKRIHTLSSDFHPVNEAMKEQGPWENLVVTTWANALTKFENNSDIDLIAEYKRIVTPFLSEFESVDEPQNGEGNTEDIYYKTLINLFKFGTEKMFGVMFINTFDSSIYVKSIGSMKSYNRSVGIRNVMRALWQLSEVPAQDWVENPVLDESFASQFSGWREEYTTEGSMFPKVD